MFQVYKNDGLPEIICEACKDKLEEAYNFRQQILLTDEKLRLNISSPKLTIKTETEEWEKIEDDAVSLIEVKQDFDADENVSLQDIFEVELHENISDIIEGNDEIIVVKNKRTKISPRRLQRRRENKNLTRVCPECGRLLKRDSYGDHMLTQHNKEFNYECDICGLKLKTKRQLWHHKKKKHQETQKINCDQCGQIFASQNNFKRHYNNVHLGTFFSVFCESFLKVLLLRFSFLKVSLIAFSMFISRDST